MNDLNGLTLEYLIKARHEEVKQDVSRARQDSLSLVWVLDIFRHQLERLRAAAAVEAQERLR